MDWGAGEAGNTGRGEGDTGQGTDQGAGDTYQDTGMAEDTEQGTGDGIRVQGTQLRPCH